MVRVCPRRLPPPPSPILRHQEGKKGHADQQLIFRKLTQEHLFFDHIWSA